jgi:hypothetical protein
MDTPVGGNAVTDDKVDPEVLTDAQPEGGEVDPQGTQNARETEEGRKKLGGWQRKIVKLETELDKWRETALNLAQRPNPEPETSQSRSRRRQAPAQRRLHR